VLYVLQGTNSTYVQHQPSLPLSWFIKAFKNMIALFMSENFIANSSLPQNVWMIKTNSPWHIRRNIRESLVMLTFLLVRYFTEQWLSSRFTRRRIQLRIQGNSFQHYIYGCLSLALTGFRSLCLANFIVEQNSWLTFCLAECLCHQWWLCWYVL
jgi:hypothetical protein